MSHKMLRPFIVRVSVLGYFPLWGKVIYTRNYSKPTRNLLNITINRFGIVIWKFELLEPARKLLGSIPSLIIAINSLTRIFININHM